MPLPISLGEHEISWRRPWILGVLNVTDDSFSDGGSWVTHERALARAIEMIEQGADWVDVGGESTRPGAAPVSESVELERVIPLVESLAKRGVVVSVDTTKQAVASAAFEVGALVLNDVGMGDAIESLGPIVARHGGAYLRMHARGTPRTMRTEAGLVRYDRGVMSEVVASLAADAERICACGVKKQNILLDPGLGFAKTAAQSLAVLASLERLVALGYPVCVGPSRKSFIDAASAYDASWGELTPDVSARLGGTAAAVALSVAKGANVLRVHDVSVMRQAARVADGVASMSQIAGRDACD
ncbi:MAG: dihydropteroate synthase [Deltaproteobacteria bacterium]|nr:dihydropteroate synthase [Deltaproteobacteria bacterium]